MWSSYDIHSGELRIQLLLLKKDKKKSTEGWWKMIAMLGATSNEASSGDLFFRFPFKVFHEESMHMTNFHAEFKSDIFEIKVEKFSAL